MFAAAVISAVHVSATAVEGAQAVLVAIFVGLVTNDMNLTQVASYYQPIVIGLVHAGAAVAASCVSVAADALSGRM